MRMSARHFIELFFVKLYFNVKSEASKTYLNYFWWMLEPILYVLVLYLVFGVFLNRGEPSFFLFLLCGQVPFLWFSKSVSNSATSIVSGKSLINQAYIPKVIFPLWTISQDLVKQFVVMIGLVSVLIFNGMSPSLSWLSLPLLMGTQFLLIGACSLVVSIIVPFIPDVRFLISTLLMMLMFGSGIFYSYKSVILPEHQQLFLLNPIANLIKNYREVLLDSAWPNLVHLSVIALISLLIILVMYRITVRKDAVIARAVL